MPLAPPPLPYPYGALEPTIDELTMRLHHDSMQPRGQTVPSMSCSATLDALPGDKRTLVRNNGVGHLDHSLFWESMAPDDHGHPADRGWSWLVHDGTGLAVTSTANQDSPPMRGHTPLLCVDVWEPAYYLRYQNRRVDYLEAWWNVVDWQRVAARYATATSRNAGGDHP